MVNSNDLFGRWLSHHCSRGCAVACHPMTTWDEGFADRYDEWAAHMTADISFYVNLAHEASGPLVELAVGNGRVAIPVARATGKTVIGIDLSLSMLEQARVN